MRPIIICYFWLYIHNICYSFIKKDPSQGSVPPHSKGNKTKKQKKQKTQKKHQKKNKKTQPQKKKHKNKKKPHKKMRKVKWKKAKSGIEVNCQKRSKFINNKSKKNEDLK